MNERALTPQQEAELSQRLGQWRRAPLSPAELAALLPQVQDPALALALGERRADSARDYLVSLGIDSNRVSIVSFGKERPAVVGSNERAWAQNRRAMIVINN